MQLFGKVCEPQSGFYYDDNPQNSGSFSPTKRAAKQEAIELPGLLPLRLS